MLNFLKKNKKILSLGTLVIFFIPPIVKKILSIPAICDFFTINMDLSDTLTYITGMFGAIGTVFLGYVAYKQNEQITANSIRRENINTKRPFLIIKNVYVSGKDSKNWAYSQNSFSSYVINNKHFINIEFLNVGDGVANNLITSPTQGGLFVNGLGKKHREIQCIPPGQSAQMRIAVKIREECNGEENIVNIIYENIVGVGYTQKLRYSINTDSNCFDVTDYDVEIEGNSVSISDSEWKKICKVDVYPLSSQTVIDEQLYSREKEKDGMRFEGL